MSTFKRFGEISVQQTKKEYLARSYQLGSYLLSQRLLSKSKIVIPYRGPCELSLYDLERESIVFSTNESNLIFYHNEVSDGINTEVIPYSFYSFKIKPFCIKNWFSFQIQEI